MPWFQQFGADGTAAARLATWTETGATAPAYCGLFNQTTATTSIYQQQAMAAMAQQTATTTTNVYVWRTPTGTAVTNATPMVTLWEQQLEHAQYLGLAQARVVRSRERTLEEQQREAELRQMQLLAHVEMAERRQAALTRSRDLLLSHLTIEQRRTFENNRWFVVEGGKSKKSYRIRTESYAGNIDILDQGRVTHRLCVHMDGAMPLYDHLLAQKLHIEYDEDALLRIANRSAA